MDPTAPPRRIFVQVGLVLALFAAALVALWYAGASVVDREERRAAANQRLEQAGAGLLREGAAAFRAIRPYPEYMGPEDWAGAARRFEAAALLVRRRLGDVECGFYVPGQQGPAFRPTASRPAGVPAGVFDDVETQADAAYRKRVALSVVEAVPPEAVAIRAVPAAVDGRPVGAVWALTRLDAPLFPDRPGRAYRLSAGLALLGIALSTALTGRLVVTNRRQAAERERLREHLRRSERLAALGRLLAGVAHEVRNPLAGIRSTAQLWERGFAVDAESVANLVREVDRLELIVAHLLQFSRAEPQPREVGSLNEVVAEAARLAGPAAGAAGVGVATDLDPALPGAAMSAPALLQVFRNLTNNALQAMPGGGSLRLATRHDAARGLVEASVADTGPGLPDEAARHLFEPFFTTKAGGTGLGLAIAREIALAHGGDLHAEGRPGGPGALFTLVLPVAPPPNPGAAP